MSKKSISWKIFVDDFISPFHPVREELETLTWQVTVLTHLVWKSLSTSCLSLGFCPSCLLSSKTLGKGEVTDLSCRSFMTGLSSR